MAKKGGRFHFKKVAKLHKVTIHPNRWLIWAVVLSVIACFGLLVFIRLANYKTDTEMMEYVPVIRRAITYTDYRLGFSLKHPVAWSAEADKADTVSFLDPQNFGEGISVSVLKPADEKTVRKNLVPLLTEIRSTVDGQPAYYITSGVRTAPEKAVLVANDGKLYVIRGTGMMFDKILKTFRFTASWVDPLPGMGLEIQAENSNK